MGSRRKQLTYQDAGVNIGEGEKFVEAIGKLARSTRRPELLSGIGGFAALARIPNRYREPIIVTSTDGVGTKLKVAVAMKRHSTIGIDLVAMCVNDVITVGAEPLCFLDYYATGRLERAQGVAVLRGIAQGCVAAGCSLAGGETAEMPSLYRPGEYELAGFAVGVVERSRIIDGSGIRPGDAVLGLASSGLHSNGYSLARKVLFERAGLGLRDRLPGSRKTVGSELLEPTRIYVREVRQASAGWLVRGMAHITGGGMAGNLSRILPPGCRAVIRRDSWPIPPVFTAIKRLGDISQEEMDRTFNNGIGFVMIVPQGAREPTIRVLGRSGQEAFCIGYIEKGRRQVIFSGGRG